MYFTKKYNKYSKKRKHANKYKYRRTKNGRTKNKKCKTGKIKYLKKYGGSKFDKKKMEGLLGDPQERMGKLLNLVCNKYTRGACLDFGDYKQQINNYFENYSINTPYPKFIRRIGENSANGFILELEYEKNNYNSNSVIKINRRKLADNLLYEYYVGVKFINKMIKIFPNFVETYKQLYMVNDLKYLQSISNKQPFTDEMRQKLTEITDVDDIINPVSNMINNACKYGKDNSVAIMIQHYSNFYSINHFLKNKENEISLDILAIIFQVYFPLNVMRKIYTHYDLHSENVFLYKPYVDRKFILMNYIFNDGTKITFPTDYIVKIIDYGRNYFNDVDSGISSTNIIENVCLKCDDKECKYPACFSSEISTILSSGGDDYNRINFYPCGENSGMRYQVGEYMKGPGTLHFINPHKKNISHDLRLLKATSSSGGKLFDYLKNLRSQISLTYDDVYGTEEIKQETYNDVNSFRIKNIPDLMKLLKLHLQNWINTKYEGWINNSQTNNQFSSKYDNTWTKMAEITIYEDMRPYEYKQFTYASSNETPSTPIDVQPSTQTNINQQLQTLNLLNSSPINVAPPQKQPTLVPTPQKQPTLIPTSQKQPTLVLPVDSGWSSSSNTPSFRKNMLNQQTPQPIIYNMPNSNSNSNSNSSSGNLAAIW